MTYGAALEALADPTRRRVFERLRRGPLPVAAIAADLPVSRPAVSQHLRVLSEARLVRASREGTRRLYSIDPQGLEALRRYVEGFWDETLAAFKARAEREEERR